MAISVCAHYYEQSNNHTLNNSTVNHFFMKKTTSKSTSSWLQALLQTWRNANTSNVWAHCASVGFFWFFIDFSSNGCVCAALWTRVFTD